MTRPGAGAPPGNFLYCPADRAFSRSFPPLEKALREPNGLLAVGGDLAPCTLLRAYRQGIFPWYSQGQPILWWSPDPRCTLAPERMKISRRLARTLKKGLFAITVNRAFDQVVAGCAAPRAGATGTWITPDMARAYAAMHRLGYGVSVECWRDGALVGGLYGLAVGKVFFGESMFSRATDASKAALAHLAQTLAQRGFRLIDCQVDTPHLRSLGAEPMPRERFARLLRRHCPDPPAPWRE